MSEDRPDMPPISPSDQDLARARAEIAALFRLTETQADQIAAATRAAALAEAKAEALVQAGADRHVLRAALQAMERRLADLQQRQAGRDAVLAEQILSDAAEQGRLAAKAAGLEQALAKARAEIGELRASTSWKVTAPLRALRELFKQS